jgi:RNA polymerase primary sigma factor
MKTAVRHHRAGADRRHHVDALRHGHQCLRGRGPTLRKENKEEAEDETDNELVEVTQKPSPRSKKSEPGERTDDPVRMYLREMGTVELLSREGEIAIAKRIEAGRRAMIAGLCESPLTFQAIIIWRDELNEGKNLPSRHHRSRGDLRRPRRQEQHEPGADRGPVGPDGQPLAAANGNGAAIAAAAAPAHIAPPAPRGADPVPCRAGCRRRGR